MARRIGIIKHIATGLIFIFVCVWLILADRVRALELANRSVVVSSALPSANATHTYAFNYQSLGLLGSMVFEYCDNSPIIEQSCNAPSGLDVTAANIASQTGNTGFSVDISDTTANRLVISRTPSASAVTPATYSFSNITNPSLAGQTIYIRISSYASSDGSGMYTDHGSVAFATNNAFIVGADVPPFIRLCAAITVAPDCSSMSGDRLNLGILKSTVARAGQSQFAVGTNSVTGYITYVLGTTMTSGNNTIKALSSPTPSFPGNSQFGINLRANTIPAVGEDPFGAGTGTVAGNYDTANQFMYSSGDAVVTSSTPSDFNRMTVSYLANIKPSQPAGIYSTTFTYLAVANF